MNKLKKLLLTLITITCITSTTHAADGGSGSEAKKRTETIEQINEQLIKKVKSLKLKIVFKPWVIEQETFFKEIAPLMNAGANPLAVGCEGKHAMAVAVEKKLIFLANEIYARRPRGSNLTPEGFKAWQQIRFERLASISPEPRPDYIVCNHTLLEHAVANHQVGYIQTNAPHANILTLKAALRAAKHVQHDQIIAILTQAEKEYKGKKGKRKASSTPASREVASIHPSALTTIIVPPAPAGIGSLPAAVSGASIPHGNGSGEAYQGIPFSSIPIINAAHNGNLATVKRLIEQGADVNAVELDDLFETTPLLEAITQDHIQISLALINAGANPDKPDFLGITPREAIKEKYGEEHLLHKALPGTVAAQ